LMDLDDEDHAHFGWGFTEEGTYDLTFEISGTHGVDGFKSATATYSFSVIPEPSSALLGAIGALGLLRRRR
jgi:surface-anchored protein